MADLFAIAGKSTWKMALRGHLRVLRYAAGVLAVLIVLWIQNMAIIFKLGLPVVVALIVVFVGIVESLIRRGPYTKKRAKHVERGTKAEEMAGEQLGMLPEGYCVFNDVSCENFNIDHIVVGPGGIFVIETKSHWGRVTAAGDWLLLNGRPPEKNFLNQVWSQTYCVWDLLKEQTSKAWPIEPLLCFTKAFVQASEPIKGVRVINIRYLRKYLLSQYRVLSDEEIKQLADLLQEWISEDQGASQR